MNSLPFNFSSQILHAVKGLQVILLDVDGVLTDGSIYMDKSGELVKKFNTLDGFGIKALIKFGYQVIVISGRKSLALERRLTDLGITHFYLDIENKWATATKCLRELNISWDVVAVMGDDLPDLPLLSKAKFSCAPSSAHPIIKHTVHWHSRYPGGCGAVRELCDVILLGNLQMEQLLELYA